jgi:hypothetical protein
MFFAHRWREPSVSRSPDVARPAVAEIWAALPEDPRLAERLASRWTAVAGEIARAEGSDGLKTLDLFEQDAAELFLENPHGFHDLASIARLDGPLLEVNTGSLGNALVIVMRIL